jgi:hypothetical protein
MKAEVSEHLVKVSHHIIGDVLRIHMWESRRGYELEVTNLRNKHENVDDKVVYRAMFPLSDEASVKTDRTKDYGIFWHQCEHEGCERRVEFDDEPFCFEHSPDAGSAVEGYSTKAEDAKRAEEA